MSSNDDYAPRSQRDRPRHADDGGLRYPNEADYGDSRKSASHRPRHGASPEAYGSDPRDEPRRKRDVDRRPIELRDEERNDSRGGKDLPPRYREYPNDRDEDKKPRRSNTTAPLARSYSEEGHRDSAARRRQDADGAAYGRSKGHQEPAPRREATRGKHGDDYEDLAPPRRAQTYREPDRRRRDDSYDDAPRPRRQRSPEDRHSDRERGYKSDGRDARRRKDDDRSDDYKHRGSRRDDGYVSDRAHKRYDDRDRDRKSRDHDRDRDRRRDDSDRDRSGDRSRDRDRKGKKGGFMDDINKYYEQGQKHYKSVAPLVSSLAKMYMDSKK